MCYTLKINSLSSFKKSFTPYFQKPKSKSQVLLSNPRKKMEIIQARVDGFTRFSSANLWYFIPLSYVNP